MKKIKKYFFTLISMYLLFDVSVARADISIGAISTTLLHTTKGFSKFIVSIMLVVGVGLLVGGGIQYHAYRKNPVHIPLSRSIRLFLLGFIILLVPVISTYSAGAYYLKNL